MSVEFWMRAATGSEYVNITDRCRPELIDVKQNAEEGSVGISTFIIDDPLGDLDVGGWKVFYILETEAEDPDQQVFYVGHSQPTRAIRRGPYRTQAAREWHVQLSDVNNIINRRILIGQDNDRNAESDVARIAWILGTSEDAVIGNTDMVTGTVSDTMDENDYLGQETFAVYNDCAQQTGNNFFLTHIGSSGPYPFGDYALFYDKPHSATYPSNHRISNLLAEVDQEEVFFNFVEDELTLDSSRIASGIFVPFQQSYVYVRDMGTVAEFTYRDLNMPAINVKNRATALRRANRYLRDNATEEHRATLHFITPRHKVNAIREGQTVEVKMSHWPEPYRSEWTAMRVLSRQITHISESDDSTYLHTIEVSRSTGSTVTGCAVTPYGSYDPLGGSGVIPNASDGVTYYLRTGIPWPQEPDVGHVGSWHFPVFGAGGSGTVDQAGDCSQNRVRLIVSGEGTMTIHTSTVTSPRNLVARLYHDDSSSPAGYVLDESETGVTGDDFTFDISTHGGVNCIHWVDLKDWGDVCGGKWGYAGMDWS
jgi:hypothetical protein